ncbi:WSC-domain-containing protein [Canariomyces notabilis]|uniref:WSC-domain-containing protein n=1 Tax=Canariomyces notabilis TaxID=2074819 RepID=A0AAN6YSA7_9PEZI|nr:WSC-domain-containing protein [Canariomyces arenarius]
MRSSTTTSTTNIGGLLLLLAGSSTNPALAQSQSPSPSSSSAPSPSPSTVTVYTNPGSGYTYHGCYNETTGLPGTSGSRALYGGTNAVRPGQMTVEGCWEICRTGAGDSNGGTSGKFKYAGLEYARECWCAQSLSSLSAKLPDSECNLPCEGNTTQACGGMLKLTVYIASSAAVNRVAWAAGLVAVGAVSLSLL